MIRVMIVEDEPPIQRSIKKSIESTHPEFEITGCAHNGNKALSILDEANPDVIFTDIRMPIMDGIELMSYLSKNHPHILVVIISGYQDFEYARKSLQYGAFDYILKPISLKSLKELLDKIYFKVISRKNEYEEKYLYNLLNNYTYDKNLNISHLIYKKYKLFLICAGSLPAFSIDYLIPAKIYWEKNSLDEILSFNNTYYEKAWVFDGKSTAEKIILLGLNFHAVEKLDELASKITFNQLDLTLPITTVISSPFSDITSLYPISQSLRTTLNEKIIIGRTQVINYSQFSSENKFSMLETCIINPSMESKLVSLVTQGNRKDFIKEIQSLFSQLQESECPQSLVKKLLKYIIELCQSSVLTPVKSSALELDMVINSAITNSCNYTQLFSNIWYLFDEIFSSATVNTREKVPDIVLKVDNFISSNITQPITNTSLSEKFGLVPSYLSKLFRDYKGMSPSEYLTALRIEKAKELMRLHPELLTKEISRMVGYTDPLHFSKIFKKELGIWPSDYKNSL